MVMRGLSAVSALLFVGVFIAGCDTGAAPPAAKKDPTPTPAPVATTDALKLGAPIDGSTQSVTLSDVAKTPGAYTNKELVTTGTVTAVCQHMGCWMEIKDDANGEAHVKMAGHKFFVPKTASGKKARIMAKLVPNADDGACAGEGEAHGQGCKAEAEQQMGHPLAKLELVADGVELL